MITVTIIADGETVAEALANVRYAAFPLRPGGHLILDGSVRPVHKGNNEIGSIRAVGTDADKIAHYTGKDFHYDTKHQSYIDAEHDI
jgi:hypothetical protein